MSSENEINSIDDLLVIFFIVVIFYASYILYFAGFFTTTTLELILTLSIAYVGCLPFILLSGMLLNFRYYNVIFINGAGNSNSFLYDFVMDIINVLAFNIRVIVQLVRILILYSTYYLLALLYDELSYNIFITSNYLTTQSFSGYLTTYVRLVFEIGHVLIIFFMQTAAFIFMLFWLFQFLFTCFSETPSELPNYNV
jgi:hypothetical protein